MTVGGPRAQHRQLRRAAAVGLASDAHLVPDHDRLLALLDDEISALNTPTASSSPQAPGQLTYPSPRCRGDLPGMGMLPGACPLSSSYSGDLERIASIERSLPGAPA